MNERIGVMDKLSIDTLEQLKAQFSFCQNEQQREAYFNSIDPFNVGPEIYKQFLNWVNTPDFDR